jgi:hypothetical protein
VLTPGCRKRVSEFAGRDLAAARVANIAGAGTADDHDRVLHRADDRFHIDGRAEVPSQFDSFAPGDLNPGNVNVMLRARTQVENPVIAANVRGDPANSFGSARPEASTVTPWTTRPHESLTTLLRDAWAGPIGAQYTRQRGAGSSPNGCCARLIRVVSSAHGERPPYA